MAKKRTNNFGGLPGVDDADLKLEADLDDTVDDVIELKRSKLRLEVPFVEGIEGYAARRIDLTMNAAQAEKLRGILQGLDGERATLESGQPVVRPGQVIQWMIENVG